MKIIINLFVTLLICYFVNLLTASSAYAQGSSNFYLSIEPAVIEIQEKPPFDLERSIIISNRSTKSINLDILIKPFTMAPDGSGTIILLKSESDGPQKKVREAIKVYENGTSVTGVGLGPGESKELVVSITVDQDTQAKDYYFSLIFAQQAVSAENTGSSALGGIGSNILLSIGPEAPAKAQIKEFSTPLLMFSGPVPFKLLLENNSNRYIIPNGQIIIKNMFGSNVGLVELPQSYILSGSKRYLGNNQVLIWPEKLLFGLYTAELNLKLSSNGASFKTKVYFLSLPLYLVIASSISVFAVLSIYIRVRHRLE